MKEKIALTTPLLVETVEQLNAGDEVLISGVIYAARDAAHLRMIDALNKGAELPFDVANQIIYYVGPAPSKPGEIIGSAGPTTSGRMDAMTPQLLACGLRGMIGKGERNTEVIEAIKKYKAVYFAAIGGAGALIAHTIKNTRVIAYEDLGPEAILELTVEDFPAIVVIDSKGTDLYRGSRQVYRKEWE